MAKNIPFSLRQLTYFGYKCEKRQFFFATKRNSETKRRGGMAGCENLTDTKIKGKLWPNRLRKKTQHSSFDFLVAK